MRGSGAGLVLLVLAVQAAGGLAAQTPDSQATAAPRVTADSVTAIQPRGVEPDRTARWRTSYFPYLTGGANDSPLLTFRVRHWQPAEYEARTTYSAGLNADAGIAPKGSRFVALSFKAPNLWTDWRLATQAAAERQVRYGFYGLGNDTQYDKSAKDADPFLYRMRRTR